MKNSEKILFALATVFLFVIIVILPLRINLFNESYYHSQFVRNNVEVDDKEAILNNLLSFFKGQSDLEYFDEREQSHLEDVKILLNKLFFSLYTSIFLFFISLVALFVVNKKIFKNYFFKILFLGGLSGFAVIILLLLAAFNFSTTFQNFHELFFSQGNYSFPATSLLITLFSENFFKSFFLKMIFSSLMLSIICMVPQLALAKMKK